MAQSIEYQWQSQPFGELVKRCAAANARHHAFDGCPFVEHAHGGLHQWRIYRGLGRRVAGQLANLNVREALRVKVTAKPFQLAVRIHAHRQA